MKELFVKKEAFREFICCENILTISPANANRIQDFQKKDDEPASCNMGGTAIIEIKKSTTPSMTESDEKRRRKALQCCNQKEGRRAFQGTIVLTSGLDSSAWESPWMSKGR